MRVLVADDNPQLRQLLQWQLERAGTAPLDIRMPADGWEAFLCCCAWRPDVVVTDIDMPVADGIMLYSLLTDRFPEIRDRFIFMSGRQDVFEEAFFQRKGNPKLLKPFQAGDLQDAIGRVAPAAAVAAC